MSFHIKAVLVFAIFLLVLPSGVSFSSVTSANPGKQKYYLPLVMTSRANTAKGVTVTHGQGTCADLAALGVSWMHDWSAKPPNCPGIEGVPMLNSQTASRAFLAGELVLPPGTSRLQLWNEPDLIDPMSPELAAQLFRAMEPQLEGLSLVSPAPSQENPEWLLEWVKAYERRYQQKPDIDIVAFHCYARYADVCIEHGKQVVAWAREWGVAEVWCTEFAVFSGIWQPEAEEFIAWMKAEPMITRWAWFAVDTGPMPLFNVHGMTAFGRWYAEQ